MEDEGIAMLKRIVWPSVAAVLLAVGAIISAVVGSDKMTLAIGMAAVTAAILATREK